MNAERLLALYDRVAEAPDAVDRLRRFVLDLAVRGKLVEQDAADEPSSELLKQIAAEKARLVKSGRIRHDSAASLAAPDQHAFPIPSSWAWVPATFPAYGVSDLGKKVKAKEVLQVGAFPVVDQGKVLVRGYCDNPHKVIRVSEPMIVFGDHTRETKLIDFDFVVGADGVKLLQPVGVDARYYFLALQWLPLDSRGYARHFKALKASAIPLPPLAEQRRIVVKVDELMGLCDRLEAARTERETARDRLTAASYSRLTAPETDAHSFRSHARFALNALPALTHRPDQIKRLRQTILDLAVRGKLVEQDPADEPASALLKRIAAEKARLAKSGEIKVRNLNTRDRTKPLEFPLPAGWALTELGQVSLKITDGAHKTPTYVEIGVPFVSVKDFSGGRLNLAHTRFIPKEEHEALYRRCDPRRGDILLGRIGTLGKAVLVDTDVEFSLFVSVALIRFDHNNLAPDFFRLLLNSPFVEEEFGRIKIGGRTHTNKLNLGDLHAVALPLPPLAEQHRIVAKVNSLMALCDQLQTSLTNADRSRQRVLDAVLHEAPVPAMSHETWAAE